MGVNSVKMMHRFSRPTACLMPLAKRSLHFSHPACYDLIDGKAIAGTIREEMKAKHGIVPGLAVVLVGERKVSQSYVGMKKKACKEAGFLSLETTLPETVSQADLVQVLDDYGADPSCHGILVQLPLPDHIDEE